MISGSHRLLWGAMGSGESLRHEEPWVFEDEDSGELAMLSEGHMPHTCGEHELDLNNLK